MYARDQVLILTAAITLALLLTGCAGRGSIVYSQQSGGELPAALTGGAGLLPAPSELAGLTDAPRRGSYVETGLIRHGMEYEGGLPSRNVSIVGETASFSPSWSESTGLGPENLAFCMFSFAAEGFDRDPQVRYGWEIAPAAGERTYLGLASWESDNWEWFLLSPAGYRPFASLEPYIGMTGAVLAVVVQTGTEVSRLRYLRLGPQQLYAELWALPATGLAPLSVKLDAQGCYCPAGTVVEAVWDFDGDGSYDVSSGALLESEHTYSAPGHSQPRVQITSSYGVQVTDSATVDAQSSWGHSWGTDNVSQIVGVATDGEGAVYAVGDQVVESNRKLLLLKYDLNGHFEWARTWGGAEADQGVGVAADAEGGIYTTGTTQSFGAGGADVLVQRWDSAGNVVWTRTWGEEGSEAAHGIALSADNVYVVGQTTGFADSLGDVLLLSFDTDGDFAWARTVGGSAIDQGDAVAAWRHPVTESLGLHIAGMSYSFESGGEAMYIRFNGDGDLLDFETWSASYRSQAESIALLPIYTSVRVFVAGYKGGTGSEDALLLEVGSVDIMALAWDTPENEAFNALAISGGCIYAGGYSWGTSDNCDGLLLGYSAEGEPRFAAAWDGMTHDAGINALAPYPDSGVLAGGSCASLADGSWKALAPDSYMCTGCWMDRQPSVTVETPDGITNESSLQPVAVTDGIEDSGGGTGHDVLIVGHAGS